MDDEESHEHPLDGLEIDELDLRIITALQHDGRRPSTEIARQLGVPRTTVARRIERLVGQRIITIGVFANSRRIGLPLHVMIELEVESRRRATVLDAVVALDEVRWVGIATGHYDMMLEAMLRSSDHLQQFLFNDLGAIEGITSVRTSHILNVAKLAFDWDRMRHASEGAVGARTPVG